MYGMPPLKDCLHPSVPTSVRPSHPSVRPPHPPVRPPYAPPLSAGPMESPDGEELALRAERCDAAACATLSRLLSRLPPGAPGDTAGKTAEGVQDDDAAVISRACASSNEYVCRAIFEYYNGPGAELKEGSSTSSFPSSVDEDCGGTVPTADLLQCSVAQLLMRRLDRPNCELAPISAERRHQSIPLPTS